MASIYDLIASKAGNKNEDIKVNVVNNSGSPVDKELKEWNSGGDYYNNKWLLRVKTYRGFEVDPDNKENNKILSMLNKNNGMCDYSGIKCPCKSMIENNICKAGLFVNHNDREIKSSTEATIG